MTNKPTNQREQRPVGRPIKNRIEPINASPKQIARAIFNTADKNIKRVSKK